MDPGEVETLIQRYQQVLSDRRERFSSDAVFGGAKYLFEKALLEEITRVREPARAESLQVMYTELASFISPKDYELVEQCRQRGQQDQSFQAALDLISQGDHETIQKELEASAIPELVRYYALYRRVQRETEARRQQAASVQSLNNES